MSDHNQKRFQWMEWCIYFLGAISVIMLLQLDAFIGEEGNALYVAHMNNWLPFRIYGLFQILVSLGMLFNLLVDDRVGLTRQGKYYLTASLFPVLSVIYGVISLASATPAPRIIQDVLAFVGIFILSLAVARHQVWTERRAARQDFPLTTFVVLSLSILFAGLAWNQGMRASLLSKVGAEQTNDRLFSIFVFLHIGVPLALLAGMWVHVQRLGQPATVMPRRFALGVIALLVALALVLPVKSEAPWDPGAVPQTVAIDWFMLFAHPLMYATSPAALWALVLGTTLLLAGHPWLTRRQPLPAAVVNLDNCNGCGRCVADCPYEALTRRPDKRALVLADRCACCGICSGACPSATPFRRVTELVSGIDLPDFTVHDLSRQLQSALDMRAETVVFRCEHAAQPAKGGEISLRCLAMLPPSFVEFPLRRGARRVEAVGCAEGACKWRLGMELCAERWRWAGSGWRSPR